MTDASIPRLIYLPKRNPRLSIEEFRERWRQHSLLGATVPELRPKFTQVAQCMNVYDRSILPAASFDYDGVNILNMTHHGAQQELFQLDDIHRVMFPDELETFNAYVRHSSLFAKGVVANEGAMRPRVLVNFLKRRWDVPEEDFASDLEAALGALVAGSDRRAVVNHVWDRQPDYNYDAVTELWFRDDGDLAEFTANRRYAETYLGRRAGLCSERRGVTMWTFVSYARPAFEGV